MSINISSEAACRKAYLNYHCYGNTMGIKPEEMGQITQAWADRIDSWQDTVSDDVIEYEFDDTDFEKYHKDDFKKYNDNGTEAAKEATGHNGNTAGQIARGSVDLVGGAAGALGTTICKDTAVKASDAITEAAGKGTTGDIVSDAYHTVAEKAADKAGGATTEAGEAAAKKAGDKVSDAGSDMFWIATATLAAAQATAYLAKKPNKEAKEACDVLQNEMTGAQASLDNSQNEMFKIAEKIINLSDTANKVTEEANSNIEDIKTEHDQYIKTLEALKTKAESGEKLTESEKALYSELTSLASETSTLIDDESSGAQSVVTKSQSSIGDFQQDYDLVAQNVGEIQGLTDYAASFDTTTQTMCYVEGAGQALNAYSGGKAALKATKFALSGGLTTAWAWGFVALGAYGAAVSGIGALEQTQMASEVGTEINMREATQELNDETGDMYLEEIDGYDGIVASLEEDMIIEIPDNTDAPEDLTLNVLDNQSPTAITTNPYLNKTKKEEENA